MNAIKESFRTAGRALRRRAAITTMVTRPDTATPIDTPEVLEFVTRRARDDTASKSSPMAALTRARAGREMTEIRFTALDAGPWPLPVAGARRGAMRASCRPLRDLCAVLGGPWSSAAPQGRSLSRRARR